MNAESRRRTAPSFARQLAVRLAGLAVALLPLVPGPKAPTVSPEPGPVAAQPLPAEVVTVADPVVPEPDVAEPVVHGTPTPTSEPNHRRGAVRIQAGAVRVVQD